MNWDQIKGDWNQLSRRIKEKGDKMTKEALSTIAGNRVQLVAVLQQHYGYEQERAEMALAGLQKLRRAQRQADKQR
jgi:uncharacterized protein YjbJ (UPF0337 family)